MWRIYITINGRLGLKDMTSYPLEAMGLYSSFRAGNNMNLY